jgi:class 3 adenylate cyclase
MTRYVDVITLDLAHQAEADYLEFCREIGGQVPVMMIAERVVPLPPVEVRRFWREAARKEPGYEAVALLMTGVVGLMAAAATHLGEQLVEVLGVRFRSFKHPADAARWLCDAANCGIEQDELTKQIVEIQGV